MKIYIASSWKNELTARAVAWFLREHEHEVDCFCDDTTGRYVFHWSEMVADPVELEKLDAITFLIDPRSRRAFCEDKKWLDWAEAVVLVLPCGNSSHMKAGYAVGQGKKLVIFGEMIPGKFDVMYWFADALIRLGDDEGLLKALS